MTVQKMIAGLVPEDAVDAAADHRRGERRGVGRRARARARERHPHRRAQSARFNVAFVRVGLSGCDIGVSWMLPRLDRRVARVRAAAHRPAHRRGRGRPHRARDARRRPTVGASTPRSETAELIVGNSPFGVRMTKEVMWSQLEIGSLQAGIDLENRTQVLSSFTGDLRRGDGRRSSRSARPSSRDEYEGASAMATRRDGSRWSPAAGAGSARRSRSASPPTAPTSRSTTARDEDAARRDRRRDREARPARGRVRRHRSTTTTQCEAMVAAVLAEFGHVDILVNNAGIASRGPDRRRHRSRRDRARLRARTRSARGRARKLVLPVDARRSRAATS